MSQYPCEWGRSGEGGEAHRRAEERPGAAGGEAGQRYLDGSDGPGTLAGTLGGNALRHPGH